jgi:hypothetical protein
LDERPVLGHLGLEAADVIDGQPPTTAVDDEKDVAVVQDRDAIHEPMLL